MAPNNPSLEMLAIGALLRTDVVVIARQPQRGHSIIKEFIELFVGRGLTVGSDIARDQYAVGLLARQRRINDLSCLALSVHAKQCAIAIAGQVRVGHLNKGHVLRGVAECDITDQKCTTGHCRPQRLSHPRERSTNTGSVALKQTGFADAFHQAGACPNWDSRNATPGDGPIDV